jgi:hypothetical protein
MLVEETLATDVGILGAVMIAATATETTGMTTAAIGAGPSFPFVITDASTRSVSSGSRMAR